MIYEAILRELNYLYRIRRDLKRLFKQKQELGLHVIDESYQIKETQYLIDYFWAQIRYLNIFE